METKDANPEDTNEENQPRPHPNGEPSRLNPYSLCSSLPGPSTQTARRLGKHFPPPRSVYHHQSYQQEYGVQVPHCLENQSRFRCCPLHPDSCCFGYGPVDPRTFRPMPWVPPPPPQQHPHAAPEVLEVVTLDSDSSAVSSCSDASSMEDDPPEEPSFKKTDTIEPDNQNESNSSGQEPVPPSPASLPRRPIWPLPDGPIKMASNVSVLRPLVETKKQARKYARWQRANRRENRRMKRQKATENKILIPIMPANDTSSEASDVDMGSAVLSDGPTQDTVPTADYQGRTDQTESSGRPRLTAAGALAQTEESGSSVTLRRSERLLGRDVASVTEPQPSTSAEDTPRSQQGGSRDE